ncbi:class I adenylate-forming enzyme family protein [Halopenitus sp. POP-27]|uniref:class I adenylate-forming enzyme family protein n=1 Tax=Halopenitus sp. POP-27 TaxID=2994425 RepID=UPI002469A967|nr:class I adenylate-forming enzyme family protein [Halopenitus sp. POP-27]
MLERNVEYRGENTAIEILDTGETWSYAEFDSKVNRLANGLRDRGIREGDRVPIVLYNTAEYPLSVFACYKIGAVPVPLNYMLTRADFEQIIGELGAAALIYDARDSEDIEAAARAVSRTPRLIEANGESAREETFQDVLESGSTDSPPQLPTNEGRLCYMLYTSGTTGQPKGVAFTQETAHHRIQEAYSAQGFITQKTVGLQLSPFFHAGGMGAMINPTLCAGGTILLAEDWGPEMAPAVIDEHNVTYVVTVPTVAKRLAEQDDIDDYDLSSIEAMQCMGAPLSKSLASDLIEKVTPNIYNSYGSTETLYDLMLRPDDLPEHAGKTGRPNPDKQVRVIEFEQNEEFDPDDRAEVEEVGRLITKGEGIMDYYFDNNDATEEVFTEGWFYTDDLAIKDEQGYVSVTGRADGMILSGGELVSPAEVEEALETHERVDGAIVVGESDEEWGERVKAFVTGEDLTEAELETYCKNREDLANYKRPKQYEIVESIERTATGKKQRFKYE